MLKIFLLSCTLVSLNAFSQTTPKPDPTSQINAEEQVHGMPGASKGGAYSVKARKRTVVMPSNVAPVENHSPANCADSLGGKGGATFTACEAGKKTR